MLCFALPPKILHGVDRLNRNFLWGSSNNKKKLHLMGWEKIMKKKGEGGLGIQATKPKNTTLLAKLNWRFKTKKSSLWVKFLSHKHCGQRRSTRNLLNFPFCSIIWSVIRKGEATFAKGFKWVAGKESGLSFWIDKWMDKGTLRSLIYGLLNRGEEKVRLKDVTSFFGWNWEGLSFVFPRSILLSMKATPIPFSNQSEDQISLCLSPSGEFNMKDAYRIANTNESKLAPRSFSGDWVWKILSLPKVKCFLW